MNNGRAQHRTFRLPPGVTEEDLLALVEGEPLHGREAAVRSAVAGDAGLSRLVQEMRADRVVLASLPEPASPEGIFEAARDQVERGALLGLASGRPVSESLPISATVRPAPRSFRWNATHARVALAASLLLAVGATAILAAIVVGRLGTPPVMGDGRVADGRPGAAEPIPEIPKDSGSRVALATPVDTDLADAAEIDLAGPVSFASLADAAPASMSPARAVELAGLGRLAIRVTSADLGRTAQRMARTAGDRRATDPWRLAESPAPALEFVALALAPAASPAVLTPEPGPPAFASATGEGADRAAPLTAPVAPAVDVPVVSRPVYAALARRDEAGLSALLAELASMPGHAAEFVELPAGVEVPAIAPPILAPTVLWWTLTSDQWAAWASVPVVVEAPGSR